MMQQRYGFGGYGAAPGNNPMTQNMWANSPYQNFDQWQTAHPGGFGGLQLSTGGGAGYVVDDFGGGMPSQQQPYNPGSGYMPYAGGEPNMQSPFGQFGHNPYESVFSSFEDKLKQLMSNYEQTLNPVQGQVNKASASAQKPAQGQTKATPVAIEPTPPVFGNVGSRLDQGKSLSPRGERKLNKLGYDDNQIYQATQAGGGMAGFQSSLGGMIPIGSIDETRANGQGNPRGLGGRNTPRMR